MKLLSKRRKLNSATASPADTAGLAAVVGPAAVENMPRYLQGRRRVRRHADRHRLPGRGRPGAGWTRCWRGRAASTSSSTSTRSPPQVAAARLRRQRARFESNRRGDAEKGRLADPMTEAAADDAAELADRIARGQSKLFRVGLYLTRARADRSTSCEEAVAHVRATAASVLLDTQPATWRQLQGWTSHPAPGHRQPRHAPGHGHRRHRLRVPARLARTCRRRCPARPATPAACSTGSTPTATASSGGTAGRQHNAQQRRPRPIRRRQVATSSSSKSCAPWPTACTSRSSTRTDEYIRLADAVGGVTIAPRRRRGPAQPARHPGRRPPRRRPAPAGPCSCTPWSRS